MNAKQKVQRKPIAERKAPEDLTEDEIKEEYSDVIDSVIDIATSHINSRLIINLDSSCTSGECVLDIDAKYRRLKAENVNIFFEEVYTECGFDMYYDSFIQAVNEKAIVEVPDLRYSIREKETGFSGRSGGHFQIHVSLPDSFVEVYRYAYGFIAYDLSDVNYPVVAELIESVNKLYDWIDQFIVDYFNNLCDELRNDKVEE